MQNNTVYKIEFFTNYFSVNNSYLPKNSVIADYDDAKQAVKLVHLSGKVLFDFTIYTDVIDNSTGDTIASYIDLKNFLNEGMFSSTGGGGGGGINSVFGRTNSDITAQSGDYAAFYTKLPISKTVAEMTSLVGSFPIGQKYIITNAFSNKAIITVEAETESKLFTSCYGTIQNGVMSTARSGKMEYILNTDSVLYFSDAEKGNIGIGFCVDFIPFDNANTNRNTFNNISGILGTWNPAVFEDNFVDTGSVVQCDNASIVAFSTMGQNSVCLVGINGGGVACTLASSKVYGSLTMYDNHQFSNCEISIGYAIDLTTITPGYNQTGKYYGPIGSTFECYDDVDTNGSLYIDITNVTGSQDYSFAGRFLSLITSSDDGNISFIATNIIDHSYIFYWNTIGKKLTVNSNVGNIITNDNVPIILNESSSLIGDKLGLVYNPILSGWVQSSDTFIQSVNFSSTYTPNTFNAINLTVATGLGANYMKVGNIVHVSGQIQLDAFSSTAETSVEIELPITSAFDDVTQCSGVATSGEVEPMSASIEAKAGSNVAILKFIATDLAQHDWSFVFTYRIL